jgi:hypothetical protein
MKLHQLNCIYIDSSDIDGLGVFTSEDITKGTIIAALPVVNLIYIDCDNSNMAKSGLLHVMPFPSIKEMTHVFTPLGYMAFLNNCAWGNGPRTPNVHWKIKNDIFIVKAYKNINQGSELTIDYDLNDDLDL